MKYTGVWLDKNEARIITLEDGSETSVTIDSNLEHFRPHGGSGTRFKGGPQDVVQDRKYLEREKHQLKNFFEYIVSEIDETEALVIFGPAETGHKLGKHLHEKHGTLNKKLRGVHKEDSLTENQLIAWVRTFFET